MQFPNVTATAEANIYFEGKVISHTIVLTDGARKTLGVIYPGSYHFGTQAAERMEITGGECEVVLDGGDNAPATYAKGQSFDVPANSGFTITTADICQYVCSFLS